MEMICKKCGGKWFYGEQTLTVCRKVIVDQDNDFVYDVNEAGEEVLDSQKPEPTENGYICVRCGEVYDG